MDVGRVTRHALGIPLNRWEESQWDEESSFVDNSLYLLAWTYSQGCKSVEEQQTILFSPEFKKIVLEERFACTVLVTKFRNASIKKWARSFLRRRHQCEAGPPHRDQQNKTAIGYSEGYKLFHFDLSQCEASIFSEGEESSEDEMNNLMNLEEFISIHKTRSLAKHDQPVSLPCDASNKNTGDILSQLLKNVHKNLGLVTKGSHLNGCAYKDCGESHENEENIHFTDDDDDEECSRSDNSKCNSFQGELGSKQHGKKRKPRTYKYNPKPVQQKTNRHFVPDTLKDEEYWERRKRNNQAAKKSREDRRRKELEVLEKMSMLERANAELTAKVKMLEKKNELLEMKLSCADMI
eukprot:gene6862-7634_t